MESNNPITQGANYNIVEPKPEELKKYTDHQELFKQYELLATEAASIILCNYQSLNMAIAMGFSESNKKFKAEGCSKQDLDTL